MAVERGVVGGNKKDTHLINLDPKRDRNHWELKLRICAWL